MEKVISFLVVLAFAFPAVAEGELCNAELSNDQLVGNYTLEIGNAIMTGGGKVVPLEIQNTIPVSIYVVGDELIMGDPPNTVLLGFAGEDEPDWHWDTDNDMAGINSEDFANIAGCGVSQLPRVIGTGTSSSSEGTPITFIYRLIPWGLSENGAHMFGALEWVGGGVTQRRIVSLIPG